MINGKIIIFQLTKRYMEIKIEGIKYNYKLFFLKNKNEKYFWSFKTICKITKKYSSINNLNEVLNILNLNTEDNRFSDTSDWCLTQKEVNRFNKTIMALLGDKKYLEYFEGKLNEDRKQGEWENVKL